MLLEVELGGCLNGDDDRVDVEVEIGLDDDEEAAVAVVVAVEEGPKEDFPVLSTVVAFQEASVEVVEVPSFFSWDEVDLEERNRVITPNIFLGSRRLPLGMTGRSRVGFDKVLLSAGAAFIVDFAGQANDAFCSL